MPNVISIVTGPIMGLQSTWFLDDTVAFAAKLGKTIHVFNIFDEIFEHEGYEPPNAYEEIMHIGELLDGYQYQFQMQRKMAYLSIARKIDKLPDTDNVIIRIPVSIEWKGIMYELKDHRLIADIIKPDKIISLIDAEWKMISRLHSNYGQLALQSITHQKDVSIRASPIGSFRTIL